MKGLYAGAQLLKMFFLKQTPGFNDKRKNSSTESTLSRPNNTRLVPLYIRPFTSQGNRIYILKKKKPVIVLRKIC
uniref:Uncharacterized protein n=1 Tax=Anguilla anguilla TaxID=7936 RepID=A0A0E9WJC4_ANGAN